MNADSLRLVGKISDISRSGLYSGSSWGAVGEHLRSVKGQERLSSRRMAVKSL